MPTKTDMELTRRLFVLRSSSVLLTSATIVPACAVVDKSLMSSPGQLAGVATKVVSPIVAGILKPFSIVWVVVDGVVSLVKAIKRHREIKGKTVFGVGEGVSADSDDAEEQGSDLPDPSSSQTNIYIAAVARVTNAEGPDCTLVGNPILPVVATRDDQRIHLECQIFESTAYRRPMKFLLVPGRNGKIAHPIPEPIADYFVSEKYCLGTPLSDPTWTNCSCGKLLVSQIFAGYPKGVIYAFDDDEPDPEHVHDGSSGARVGECKLEKADDPDEPYFPEPTGELCVVE